MLSIAALATFAHHLAFNPLQHKANFQQAEGRSLLKTLTFNNISLVAKNVLFKLRYCPLSKGKPIPWRQPAISVFRDSFVPYSELDFLAPLAKGQQAIVMALCLSSIHACVCYLSL